MTRLRFILLFVATWCATSLCAVALAHLIHPQSVVPSTDVIQAGVLVPALAVLGLLSVPLPTRLADFSLVMMLTTLLFWVALAVLGASAVVALSQGSQQARRLSLAMIPTFFICLYSFLSVVVAPLLAN